MFKRAVLLSAMLSSTAAFGAEEPKWLKDARAREIKSQKLNEFKSKDGWFKASVPGKVVNTVEEVEGSYSVELDIGGEGRVYCEVYPKGVDLANSLRVTFTGAKKEIETSQGKLEAHALESSDAGAYGPVPYLSLSWIYRIAATGGSQLGALKQFVLEKHGVAVYCSHNELGFSKTFAAIAKGFADTLTTTEPVVAPQFVEISTVSMAGTDIGFAFVTVTRDSEGDLRASQTTAMLIATGDGNVQSQDSAHIDWIRPDGTLINSANTDVESGEIANNLSLKEVEGTWTVEGELQGKAVKATLPKDAQPGNWVAQAREVRALLARPDAVGKEHSARMWIAENPDKLTEAKTKILARQGDKFHTGKGELGSMSLSLTLDNATGMASTGEATIGPLKLKFDRVYVNGSF
jgi:hypothetical protein